MDIKKVYNKINDYIGGKLSFALSTMEMFWLVLIIVLLPLLWQRPDSSIAWVQYISTAILQAVALPLLGYTTKKSGESQEKVIKDTHDILMKELSETKHMHKEQMCIIKEIKEIHKHLDEKLSK